MIKKYSLIFLLTISAITSHAQWTALSGPPGGDIRDIEIDGNNKLYTVVAEKIYTSTNDGASWTQLIPTSPASLGVSDLLVDGTTLYAVNYSYLFKSDDGGANWIKLNSATASGQFYGVESVIKVANNVFAVFGWNGLFVSSDGGVNWTKINNNGVYSAIATTAGDLFMGDQNLGVRKHAFTAGAWTAAAVTTVYARSNDSNIRLGYKAPSTIFLSVADNIYKSTNGFSTAPTSIKTATITEPGFYSTRWGVAPNGSVYLFNGYYSPSSFYVTTNDGTSWTARTNPSSSIGSSGLQKVLFTNATTGYAATYGDGVFKTTDGGSTWNFSSTGINFFSGEQIEVAANGNILVASGYSHGYWFSTNAGVTWNFKSVNASSFFSRMTKMPNNTLLAHGSGLLHYSSDNGTNWTASAVYRDYITFNTSAPSGTTVYGTNGSSLSSSTNGSTWTTITVTGLPSSYNLNEIAEDDGGLLYVKLNNYAFNPAKGEIYRITLTGATTATAAKLNVPLTAQEEQYGTSLFVNNNKVYCGTGSNIYYSSNQGATWGTISFSHQKAFGLVDGARKGICASSSGTLYVTQDDGQSWTSHSLPSSGVYSYVSEIAVDGAGDFYASAYNSPALKNTANLLVDPATLPPYINFNWQTANGPWGGYINKVFVDDPATLNSYALKEGFLYKTPPAFASWTRMNNPNGYAYDYLIDKAANPDRIYAVHWSDIRTTIDGGTNWTILNNENINGRVKMERCSNGDLVLISTTNNNLDVYVSINGGTTFGSSKFSAPTSYYNSLIVTSSATPGIFLSYYDYTAQQTKISRSLDRGVTWGNLVLPIPTNNLCQLSANGTELYATGSNNIYKSTDNGATWNSIKGDLPAAANPCSKVYKSPTNDLFFLGSSTTNGNYGFYKSANNGTNWVYAGNISVGQNPNIQDVTWNGTRIIVATSNGILTSDDAGATFTNRSTGIPNNVSELELTTPQRILGAGNGFFTYNLTDWTKGSLDFRHFYRTSSGRFFADTYNEYYESTDNGGTWTKVALFPNGDSRFLVTQDGTTFFAASYNKLFYTNNFTITNNQTTWTEFTPSGLPAAADRNITGISLDPSGLIFVSLWNSVAQANEVYQIIFGTALKLNQVANPRNILYSGGKTIIYDGNGAIYSTTDGSSFTQKAAPGGDKLIITEKNYYFIPVYPGNLWLSRDVGQTWQQVGLNNNQYSFTDLVINEFNGYAYAAVSNLEVRKSANIVIPDDGVPPAIATLVPANNATNVLATTKLTITFDEASVPVATKKLRIFDLTNLITPVEEVLATAGVQNGKSFTYTLTTTPAYLKTYFVIIENGSFRDIFGNAHAGILNNTTWRFTIQDVPDATAPAIAYTQSTFTKGQANTLSITATDNAGGSGINASTVKLFYRGTMSSAAAAEVAMANASGSTFQVSVPDTWFDELGLEFYFTAADVAGNTVRSPIGTGYHHSRISYPDANKPTIPSGFIGVGGKAADYKMFSIPYDLASAAVGTIFNELGNVDNTEWRVVQYNNSSNSYADATTLSRGAGYWINTKTTPSSIAVEGASTPNETKGAEFQMSLKPGWNLIGNPYPFNINWAIVKASNVAIGDVKTYNGSFVTDNILSPFEAGFVNLSGAANATVTVPFSAKSGRLHDPSAYDGLWLLPISIEYGGMKNTMGGVGMHAQAASGIDQFDDVPLPRLFDMPEVHFSHPEHAMKNFTRDIVPVQNEYEWRFTADVPEGNQGVLSWNYQDLGEFINKDLFLLDETTQTLVNMLEQKQYSFLASKSATFKVFYGADLKSKIKPTSIMLGKPYPNPTQSSSSVSFALPENAAGKYNVVLDVYDLLGNKITTLTNAQLSAGFHTTSWSPEQTQIAPGLYIYKLMVNDHSSKKILTEKLLIKK